MWTRSRAVSTATMYWSASSSWRGFRTQRTNDRLDFICLREYSPAIRIEVIDYALRRSKGYGLVVIDGIRDLMLDINSTSESVEVINKMMEWSSKYDLHITACCTLDRVLRGQ